MTDRDAVPPPLPGTQPGPQHRQEPPPLPPPLPWPGTQPPPVPNRAPGPGQPPYPGGSYPPYQAPYNSPLPPVPPPPAPAPAAGTPGQASEPELRGLKWKAKGFSVAYHIALLAQFAFTGIASERGFMYPNISTGAPTIGLVTLVATHLVGGVAPRVSWLVPLAGAAAAFGLLAYHLIRNGDTRFLVPLMMVGAAGVVLLLVVLLLLVGTRRAASGSRPPASR